MHRQRFGVVASVRPQPSNSTPRSISGSSTKSQAPERARAGLVPAQNDRPHSSSTLLQRQKYIVVDVKPSDAARSSAVCAFRSAARQSALKSLLPGVLWSADAFSPTLASLEPLKRVVPFELHGPLLQPPPDLTALEIADGKPLVAFLSDGSNAAASGIDQLAAFFDSMVPFATEAVRTRISYWMAWRQFVSFLFLKGCVLEAFPASDRAIRAFLAHLLLCGYAGATYDRFYAAIVQRHRAWGGMLPIQLQKFRAWIETIQKQLGVPKKLKFAILPEHLRAIFLLQRTTITDCRDVAIIGSGTIYALRPSEVIGIDTCDLLWDEDGPGTHAFDILRRKKDQTKHGLRPRAEKAQNPDLCILAILAEYQKRAGLTVSPNCTKKKWPRSPCLECGKFFRKTTGWGKRVRDTKDVSHPVDRSVISAAIRRLLGRVGVEASVFTPVSMRRGGISAAMAANVPLDVRNLQSGHHSDAWKDYADISQRKLLYAFSRAFGF